MPNRPNFPIPAVIDPPKQCIQIMIPSHPDWKAVISGLLFELSYWYNWERTGDTSGAQCAAVWKEVYNSIDWGDMSCCCEEKARTYRINPDTGNIEQSTDNGQTWQPAAGGLASYIVKPVPPVTSGVAATKCDAATNVSGQVDVWIAQVSNDFTTATSLLEFGIAVLEAILIAVVTILSAGTLTAAEALVLPTIAAALYAAWGAGKTIFDAYWSTDIKTKILCAAYCNIGDDGSFSDAQFSAFWTEVNTKLPPSPAKMLFMGFLSSVGMPGLNAMAATGASADADCSDCNCDETCSIDLWYSGIVANGGIFYPYAETSRGGNQIVVPSFDRGDGTQEVSITTKLADVCCGFHVTLDPPIDIGLGQFYVPCGTTADYEHLIPMGDTPTTASMNTYQIVKGSVPFTATFTFDVP